MENKTNQALVLLSAILWVIGTTIFIKPEREQYTVAVQEGFLAPDFTASTSSGSEVSLTDFRGQVVLVNLWASWCKPCQAEIPAMESAYRGLRDRGFTILAVNMTNQDSASQAESFIERLGATFPIVYDTTGNVEALYGLRALPTSFFIDEEGIIQSIIIGGPMPESLVYSKAIELLEDN